eukprot:TRINITY_DN9104_c0_g1_i1.p1 TRINITY_DN9104_c0_g1~~TRINITY_DN9104_c0_g1_i1.p1  ORF type:complete len:232 (-),score=74.37 TRINITY_DN9104_c0_g1_i1:137-832(-)
MDKLVEQFQTADDSDEEDDDYQPVEEEDVESGPEDDVASKQSVTKKRKSENDAKKFSKRGRSGGISISDEESPPKNSAKSATKKDIVSEEQTQEALRKKQEEEELALKQKEQERANRVNSVWEELKRDETAKPSTESIPVAPTPKADAQKVVQETQVYDFAGEKVKVTKSVPIPAKGAAKPPAKKGLDNLLAKMKPQKMSTLQKSKHDWDNFKEKNKLSEELTSHVKSSNR